MKTKEMKGITLVALVVTTHSKWNMTKTMPIDFKG